MDFEFYGSFNSVYEGPVWGSGLYVANFLLDMNGSTEMNSSLARQWKFPAGLKTGVWAEVYPRDTGWAIGYFATSARSVRTPVVRFDRLVLVGAQ